VAGKKLLALMMPRTTPSMEAMMPAVAAARHSRHRAADRRIVRQPAAQARGVHAARQLPEGSRARHSPAALVGVRSFGLLLADDAFGRDTLVGIDTCDEGLQIEPVAVARMDNRKADVAEPVRVLAAQRPQVVMLVSSAKAAAAFIQAYRAQGINRHLHLAVQHQQQRLPGKALGTQARGAIVMQVMPSPYSATTALAREYTAAAAAQKQPVSYAGLYGFASAKLLVLGLQRAGRDPTPPS
jgi:branched-chain amino acid transport system substrate-binding protein